MPVVSHRQSLIKATKEMLAFCITKHEQLHESNIVHSNEFFWSKQNIDILAAYYLILTNQRYSVKKTWSTRLHTGTFLDLLQKGKDAVFISKIRMSKDAFKEAVKVFGDYKEFKNFSKEKVELHFLITFYRLGSKGSAASTMQASDYFGVSDGTVINYTKRTIRAILAKENQYVYWPNMQERQHIAEKISEKSPFRSCVGFVDGTFIKLEQVPSFEKNSFQSYEGAYGIATVLVCDHQCRIRFCGTGAPGAIHDDSLYQKFRLAKYPERHFSSGEYILADSAYKASPTVIPCYKTDSIQATREEIERFNIEVNKTRVPIEHCNGILKGKFQSLQDLRVRINSSASITEAGIWVRACCVMHDFLLDDSVDIDEYQESCRQETSGYPEDQSRDDSTSNFRRNQLKNDLSRNNASNQ